MERTSKRLSCVPTNNAHHRLSDGLHPFASAFAIRSGEMTDTYVHHPSISFDQANILPLTERTATMNRHFHRTFATNTTVIMQDDEYITTPTKRVRGNSVFEESLLNAHNYIKRKFSYGSSE